MTYVRNCYCFKQSQDETLSCLTITRLDENEKRDLAEPNG